ncbi:MAG: hypothetical protein AB1391_03185 [Candidatus Micrarchaeota archaeon]
MSSEITSVLKGGVMISIARNQAQIIDILDDLINSKKMLGVYLSSIQPHDKIIEELKKDNIESTSLFFLDTIGKNVDSEQNVFILRDPSDLTELSVIITEIMENECIEFLILDTIDGLGNYTDIGNIKKFLQSLVNYMKKLNKLLIVIYEEKENAELKNFVAMISNFHKKI